ncbi:C-terminal processing protease CtpA/Prc, contains a PDZ domain [Marivirga sericea]|uniref:C-terminal processing protease CtpA/Prc, contains a PDZ domain n=1 Tax=Marivirga sericea TaxID=1028 RepID=A0A1X7ITB1_9BACT|nr:S41 family peptidase [Marivirga sericea]SMG18288.1 C-terminal processing protease CtpA/Prc, contains a PDZ domain [Marivirga sericea]
MKKTLSYFLLAGIIVLSSCRENEPEPEPQNFENGTNEYVNNWIYDNMNLYYYWTADLPGKSIDEENPEDYFYSLISNSDRFSWIQPNFRELLNSLQGITLESGYEFILYRDQENENRVIGQIAYVKNDSPAENVGLKRGDLFTAINGTTLTIDNYNNLLGNIRENHNLTIRRYDFESEVFDELGNIELNAIQFAENPNHLDTVYTRNGKKIGYYVYNLFAVGTDSDSAAYAMEMDNIFEGFKSAGIDHLVLDLRYNSGGAERATINLASLIGSNISDQDIFVKRDYNEGLKQAYINEYGEESLNRKFVSKAENIGNNLQSPQLTVLTSSRTASASELLINGLNPFMDTYIIGDTTVGKNVGSTSFFEEDNPDNNWGMQPIITKSFNSLNQSDYDLGFYPDIPLRDNSLIKFELGDVNEKLLREALIYLAGSDEVSRKITYKEIPSKDILGSMELKRRFGIYDIDLK